MKRFWSVCVLLLLVTGCTRATLIDKNYTRGQYQVTQLTVTTRLSPTDTKVTYQTEDLKVWGGSITSTKPVEPSPSKGQADLPQALQLIDAGLRQQLPQKSGLPPVRMHVEITSLGTKTETYTEKDENGKPTKDDKINRYYRIEGVVTLLAPDNHVIADSVLYAQQKVEESYVNSSLSETITNNLFFGSSSAPDIKKICNDFVTKTVYSFYP